MDFATGTDAIEQEPQTDTAPKTDIGDHSARRDRQSVNRGRHVLAIADIEGHTHEPTHKPARMPGLPGKLSEDPAPHIHAVIVWPLYEASAFRGGCCIKPSRKSCCAIADMAVRAARSGDLWTDARRVTDELADFGTHP